MTTIICLFILILLGYFFVAKLGKNGTDEADLKIVSRAALSQKTGVACISVEGRRLLVGYGEGSPSLILELDASPGESEILSMNSPDPDHADNEIAISNPASSISGFGKDPEIQKAGLIPVSATSASSALKSLMNIRFK